MKWKSIFSPICMSQSVIVLVASRRCLIAILVPTHRQLSLLLPPYLRWRLPSNLATTAFVQRRTHPTLTTVISFALNSGHYVVCFAKSTFQQQIKGIPSRIPPGYIQFRSKSFFSWDKSKRSQHLLKNEGLLHCKFLLSLHLARLREVKRKSTM